MDVEYTADLRTMSKRVESEQYYVTFEMFVADAKRMFANARTYNSPETIYYKCATRHGAFVSYCFQFFILFFKPSNPSLDTFSWQAGSTFSKQSSIRSSSCWCQSSTVNSTMPSI